VTPALRLVESPVTKLAMASHKAVLMMAWGTPGQWSLSAKNDTGVMRMRQL